MNNNYSDRIQATSKWKNKFSDEQLDKFHKESLSILNMNLGKGRREKLLALLSKGFRICINFSQGGSWNSKDSDLKYLLKKGKIKKYKQYEYSAITENKSHTYLGLGE